MSLSDQKTWLKSQSLKPGNANEICQCGTEDVIKRSTDQARMRAVLLSYTFADQFIFTHFGRLHSTFKTLFPGPKLRQHSFGGHATPSWFLYSRHDYDKNADWELISTIFHEAINSCRLLVLESDQGGEKNFWYLVFTEVRSVFEKAHQDRIISRLPSDQASGVSAQPATSHQPPSLLTA